MSTITNVISLIRLISKVIIVLVAGSRGVVFGHQVEAGVERCESLQIRHQTRCRGASLSARGECGMGRGSCSKGSGGASNGVVGGA